MGSRQIVAVLQLGGVFTTDDDGHMTYSGGEAHAMLVKSDLKRMVEFHADSETTDIYVIKKVDNRVKSSVADSSAPADSAIVGTTPDGSKRQKICASWENTITGVGQVFEGPKEFRDALHKYAIAHRFHYRFVKNDSSRVTVECTDEGCPWRIHASKSSANQEFMIKKVVGSHTCESETVKSNRLASQKWVASVIKEKLRDSPNYRPRDIANDLQREYGLSLNYSQAWRGKLIARKELYSPHEEACNQLPWFRDRIFATNPGSMATVEALEGSKFRFFVAFHASLHGFENGCRPLLFLDVITVKPNKHWKLLGATSVDGEGDVFPVALSVVDDESQENWHWFLEQLQASLPMPGDITFISNGRSGLWDDVSLIFPDSYHGYNVNFFIEEFKTKLDDSWSEEVKDIMVEHLKDAIYSCRVDEFNHYLDLIKAESDKLAEWLLETKPERWSDALFKGSRLGQYTCNISETIAEWIPNRYELPVVQLLDTIRCNLMEMIYTRRESSNTWSEVLTPSANQKLQEEMNKALSLSVVCSTENDGNNNVFEVCDGSVYTVNIDTWECTCRKWHVSGIPCCHAIAVFEQTDQNPVEYCSKYFRRDYYRMTYAMSINPIPDVIVPPASTDVTQSMGLQPCPILARRQVGRPKEKPADPRIAIKRAVRCSRCKGYGHNKATCKVPLTT
uniref:SWIM-type domain-containing protein n=1 Tax=Aegilops tauschii subsp. strangulata TaxID=200361 RepID=A0A453NNT3_AEGTS